MFCTLLPFRGWKGGCLSTASSGQVGGIFHQLFYSVWICILCDFHLCLLQNRSMNVHLHRQSVLCCCTLPPWRLKGRMLEYCIIRSGWRSFPSTFFTVNEFLFFVISISVCCKTELWMYTCIDNQYYVAVLYLPGGWKGGCLSTASSGQVGGVFRQLFYSVWIFFFVISIHVSSKTEVWMYICMDNNQHSCCCTLLAYNRGWKGGCLSTPSSIQVGGVFRQFFLQCMN